MIWNILEDRVIDSVEDLRETLLKNRNITDRDNFLTPRSPFDTTVAELGFVEKELTKALTVLTQAIKNKQKILVYGDYDADGICAASIVVEAMLAIGVKVSAFIPDRKKHGYGLTTSALTEIFAENKPDLIITVDNGIVAHDAIAFAEAQGVTVILTDHHVPLIENGEISYPSATAIFHSTQLCGATVAWIFMREFLLTQRNRSEVKEIVRTSLDLCALATVADLVVLLEANRNFVRFGVQQLLRSKRLGLKTLLSLAKIETDQINAGTIGYRIAPMINAMGRISHGGTALELLVTEDEEEAVELAQTLMATNKERQDMTVSLFEAARNLALAQADQHVIIVASEDFHEGVIGLIAGRLVEEFSKPAIALSISQNEMKASVRSVPGVHIVEFLEVIRPLTLSLGGHPMAGGFSIETTKFDEVKQIIFDHALQEIDKESLQKYFKADCVIDPSLVAMDTIDELSDFAPYGKGNSQPLLVVSDMNVQKIQRMGAEQQHMRLVVTHSDLPSKYLTVLCWQRAADFSDLSVGDTVSILGQMELNHWNGRTSVQFVAKDMKKKYKE